MYLLSWFKIRIMIKFIYILLIFPIIFSCGEDLKPDPTGEVLDNLKKEESTEELSEKKEIKTITWDQAKEYGELKEDAFLKHELFNEPDKTKIDTNSIGIVHTYYYKKKLDTGSEKRDWYFSFTKGNCFSHGWAMNTFK